MKSPGPERSLWINDLSDGIRKMDLLEIGLVCPRRDTGGELL
jgi:hypothetical protein